MTNNDELYKSFQSVYQKIKKELKRYGIEVLFTSVGEQDSELKIRPGNMSPHELPQSLTKRMLKCMELFEQLKIYKGKE